LTVPLPKKPFEQTSEPPRSRYSVPLFVMSPRPNQPASPFVRPTYNALPESISVAPLKLLELPIR